MTQPIAGTVHQLRRNWYVPLICLAMVVGGLAWARLDSHAVPFSWLAIFWGGVFGPLAAARNAFRLATMRSLEATPKELRIAGRSPIAVEDIAEAKILPRGMRSYGDTEIALVLRDRKTLFLTTSREFANRILATLAINPGERRASFVLTIPFAHRYLAAFAFLETAFLLFMHEPFLPALVRSTVNAAFTALFLAAIFGLIRKKLVVGADGFTLRWLFGQRFYSFSDIDRVDAEPMADARTVRTVVRLRSRKNLHLRALDTPDDDGQRGAESRAMLEHVREAFLKSLEIREAAEVGVHLRRGDRTAKQWLHGLDDIVRGGGTGYRTAALGPELLTNVLRAGDKASDLRVGAAAALVRIGGEEHRQAVRIAAEACAEPRTRAALLELADAHSDTDVEVALEKAQTT